MYVSKIASAMSKAQINQYMQKRYIHNFQHYTWRNQCASLQSQYLVKEPLLSITAGQRRCIDTIKRLIDAVRLFVAIPAHIVTLPPPKRLWRRTQLSAQCSPRLWYTLLRPSTRCHRKWNSSVNRTRRQSASRHRKWCLAHSKRC